MTETLYSVLAKYKPSIKLKRMEWKGRWGEEKKRRRTIGGKGMFIYFILFFSPEKTGTKMALESMCDMCSNLFLGVRLT